MDDRQKYLPSTENILSRPRVSALFQQGAAHSLVTVVTAPGYGKTIAAAAFALQAKGRLVWLDIVDMDNEPSRFWKSVIGAVSKEMPRLAQRFEAEIFPGSPASFDGFLGDVSREVLDGERVLVIVDNFDCLTNGDILLFFNRLVEMGPENLCLVLMSSSKRDMGLRRGKNTAGPFRITAEDLQFTNDEAIAFFDANEVALPPAEISRIVRETDGWPLALYLICDGYRRGHLRKNTTDSPIAYIVELFETGYFLSYDTFVQKLFVKLSLLPFFSLEVISALDPGNCNGGTEAVIYNDFVAYDFAAKTYRFYGKYREFLSFRHYLLNDEDRREVYLVAGAWFQQNGMYCEALDCFFGCAEYDRFLNVLLTLPKGRTSVVLSRHALEYMERFPDEYKCANRNFLYAKGFFHLNHMEVEQAYAIFKQLVDTWESAERTQEDDVLLGEAYAVLSNIGLLRNTDNILDDIKRAETLLPNGSYVQDASLMMVGNNSAFYLPGNEAAEIERMLALFSEYAPIARHVLQGNGYGCASLYAAEAAHLQGKMEQARNHYFRAIYNARECDQHDIVCNCYYLLTHIAVYYGDYRGATENLEALSNYIGERGLQNLYEIQDCAWSWFHIKVGDLDCVPRWVVENDERYYAQMPMEAGRNRLMSMYYLIERHDYYEAQAAMGRMRSIFAEKGLWYIRLVVYILESECLLKTGDRLGSAEVFAKAYEMSWRNNIVMPFIELGNVMRGIVDNARKARAGTFDENWLSLVYQGASAYAKRLAAVRREYNKAHRIKPQSSLRLSQREKEALDFLAQGMTREEIASVMEISLSGVKKHVRGIYNKLGAINRADAIRIATSMGIIE